MGKLIYYNDNPLALTILNVMLLMDKKVKTDSVNNLVKLKCFEELKTTLLDLNQLSYLDFNIKFDSFGDKCDITANNIVTALWFCGIYPIDAVEVTVTNRFYLDEEITGYYNFNKKTKKLKFFEKI